MIEAINSELGSVIEDQNIKNKEGSSIDGKNFSEYLNDKLNEVNEMQLEADQLSEDFALGKVDNVHEVTVATEKAKLALDLTLAIQGKVVDAYNEIMRMQV